MFNLPTAGVDYQCLSAGAKASSHGPREQGSYAVNSIPMSKRAMSHMTKYTREIWPSLATPFHDDGTIDYDGMRRVLGCLIESGGDGICILFPTSRTVPDADDERGHADRHLP